MSVYQVAIIFEAHDDASATEFAEKLAAVSQEHGDTGWVENAKIAFTKYEPEVSGDEKEATEVADV